jgi:hypothetical protein
MVRGRTMLEPPRVGASTSPTRDAAGFLVDVLHLVPRKDLTAYTEIVGTLNTVEQRLIDLTPPKS